VVSGKKIRERDWSVTAYREKLIARSLEALAISGFFVLSLYYNF
jgi:hypothetical protein